MNARRRYTHALATSSLLVIMAAIWIVLAPANFGGQDSDLCDGGPGRTRDGSPANLKSTFLEQPGSLPTAGELTPVLPFPHAVPPTL